MKSQKYVRCPKQLSTRPNKKLMEIMILSSIMEEYRQCKYNHFIRKAKGGGRMVKPKIYTE